MIAKKKISLIKSLTQKKFRQKEQLILVEGDKLVSEILNSKIHIKELFATEIFLNESKNLLYKVEMITEITAEEIKKASLMKNPQHCLAICQLPPEEKLPESITGISFFLDGIQDPGNLGTIIRTCDWFGMEYVFCSPDTVDVYNPKVIQSSMGSFHRMKIVYTEFEELNLICSKSPIPVLGTFIEGKSLFSFEFPSDVLVVMGNEGNGIRPEVAKKISTKLYIPSFNSGKPGAESLNVAVVSGIIGSEFRRQSTGHTFIQNES